MTEPEVALAVDIWAKIRTQTESPSDGMAVLSLVTYRFWKECNSIKAYPIDEFLKDMTETVEAFHLIQDIKGNA